RPPVRWQLTEAFERPPSVFGHQFIFRLRQPLQGFPEPLQPGVSHGDRYIPQKTAIARPRNWCVSKHLSKLGFTEARKPLQWRGDLARRNRGAPRNRRTAIPRTDIVADAAAEDMPADRRPVLFRNGPVKLDCEIGDAAARIDGMPQRAGDNGVGRTRVDAAR